MTLCSITAFLRKGTIPWSLFCGLSICSVVSLGTSSLLTLHLADLCQNNPIHCVTSAVFSADSQQLLFSTDIGLYRYNITTQKTDLIEAKADHIYDLALSTDQHYLAWLDGKNDTFVLFDLKQKKSILTKPLQWAYGVKCLAFSRNNQWLALPGPQHTLLLHRIQRNEQGDITALVPYTIPSKKRNGISSLCFNHSSEYLAVGYQKGYIGLLDVKNKKWIEHIGQDGMVRSMDFSPNDHLLLTSYFFGKVRLFSFLSSSWVTQQSNLLNKKLDNESYIPFDLWKMIGKWSTHLKHITTLDHYLSLVESVKYHPSGKFFAVVGWDKKLRLYTLKGILKEIDLPPHGHGFTLAFSPDGQWLFIGGDHQLSRMYKVNTDLLHTLSVSRISEMSK